MLLKAGLVLENAGICHADIQPSNIMLDTTGHMVLIDLGAAVQYGEKLDEYTPHYGLDHTLEAAGPIYDINSIASTLIICAERSHNPQKPYSRADFLAKYSSTKHPGAQLACALLTTTKLSAAMEIAKKWLSIQDESISNEITKFLDEK